MRERRELPIGLATVKEIIGRHLIWYLLYFLSLVKSFLLSNFSEICRRSRTIRESFFLSRDFIAVKLHWRDTDDVVVVGNSGRMEIWRCLDYSHRARKFDIEVSSCFLQLRNRPKTFMTDVSNQLDCRIARARARASHPQENRWLNLVLYWSIVSYPSDVVPT